ncbi:MAG: NAD(P)-dependent oxidoreductase [candidate division Zixibacteria bacterium]|nr:NAD(P)-dependent oxidoreductase [candidate division Zixibacteria bacterium]
MQTTDAQTVTITGANGFIGSRVCRLLASKGYNIRIICRLSSDLKLLENVPYTKIIADITDPDSLKKAVYGTDYIIHLAGLVKAKKNSDYFAVNQQGTINLLNAIKNHNLKLKKFVLISSLAAFGPSKGIPRKESDSPNPLTTYGKSKLAGEEALDPYRELIPITVLRPPGVYGPGDTEIFTLFDIVNKGFKPYMAGGNNKVQLIYVDDLAEAIKASMEIPESRNRAYMIAENRSYTTREMLNIIGELLGKKGIGITIPRPLLNLIALFSELFFKLIGHTPHFSREKVRELTDDWEMDVSRVKNELGFEAQVDFRTGARLTIEWYRQKGWLK